MDYPVLYRKRIIPAECLCLKDDEILYMDDSHLVTKWKAIRPKKDLRCGYSCYFLKKGYKVSKFYDHERRLMYHYCDIVSYEFTEEGKKLITTDLLVDVRIYPDGRVEVLDLDELSQALKQGDLTVEQAEKALETCNSLLELIYNGHADELLEPFAQAGIEND
ncbi:MAG: DUF402 domain-containing protein [Lachnospiraceae bacterium]|nr:DUF402 domain-containing protein [Lachnospiraceae bacterium]